MIGEFAVSRVSRARRFSGLSNGSDRGGTDNSNASSSKTSFINKPPPASSERKCLEDRYVDSMISLSSVRLNATEDAACNLDDGDLKILIRPANTAIISNKGVSNSNS